MNVGGNGYKAKKGMKRKKKMKRERASTRPYFLYT